MSDAGENTADNAALPQVGAVLAAARNAQGMSVADVAHQMKLSMSQVEALEADDFERLPGNIFVRGFVRNYAKLLELDPDPLLSAVGKIYAAAPTVQKSPTLKMIPFPSKGVTAWQKYAVAAGVVAVLLLIYQGLRDEPVQNNSAPPTLAPPNTAPVEAPAAVSAEPAPAPVDAAQPPAMQAPVSAPHEPAQPVKQSEKAAAVSVEDKRATQQSSKQPVPPVKTVVAAPQPAQLPEKAKAEKAAAEPKPVAPPPVMVVPGTVPVGPAHEPATAVEPLAKPAGGGTRGSVQLYFGQDAWVIVKAEDGKVIYSRNHVPAGTHQSVRVTTPFSVTIGNAAGSKVEFNHRPIDLAPYTKDGVVRLTVSK